MEGNTSNYAEQNGELIFYIFEDQWKESASEITAEVDKRKIGSKTHCGLYLFSLQSTETQKRYPVYIGYTGRTFADRFYEHAIRESGAIYKVLQSKVFGDSFTLFVHSHPMTPVAAKVLESIFLNTFNFALNTEENGKTHALDPAMEFRKEASIEDFKAFYQKIMKGLIEEIQSSFHGMNLEWSK